MKLLTFLIISLSIYFYINTTQAQSIQDALTSVRQEYKALKAAQDSLSSVIEELTQQYHIELIHKKGLPETLPHEEIICHSAMCLLFSHEYRLAKWVVHLLTGDIIEGRVSRTNDFREDPKIPNTGVEADYFIKTPRADGTFHYDGFGYDRGHLAPSADFRWSETALSESYYYSNITPQTPEFNREKWAEIEGFLRAYIYNNPNNYLYIITAPVLQGELPIIDRGVNKLPIPQYHYKIAMDFERKIGIAFLVPQRNLEYPIEWYAVAIDSIETLTGINFFPTLTSEDEILIESQFNFSDWLPENRQLNVSPLRKEEMPRNAYNTVEAKQYINYHRERTICGTVVHTHKSRKGNIFINLDQQFPNQIFSVTIFEKDVINFQYEPDLYLKNKRVCVTGKISDYQGVPSMIVSSEKKLDILIND